MSSVSVTGASANAKSSNSWSHGVAGASAGVITTALLHPLDLIKIRFQVHDGSARSIVPQYRGLANAFRSIIRQEGVWALYQGVQPALVGSTLAWGSYFYCYDSAKSVIRGSKADSGQQLGFQDHMGAAALAATGTCLLTNPMWLIKTRMCLEVNGATATKPGSSFPRTPLQLFRAMQQIAAIDGLGGFYRGFGPGWLFFVVHGAVQFAVYEDLKRRCRQPVDDVVGEEPKYLGPNEAFWCGGLSKFVAIVATFPIQLVRARLQQQGAEQLYTGVWHVLRVTVAQEGVRGLYKGIMPNIIQRAPQSAITLTVYEQILQHIS